MVEDQIVQHELKEIRDRLNYAERNINSHILDDSFISSKVAIDGIVLSILRNAKDSLTQIYKREGLDPAEMLEAFEVALKNCDSRDVGYAERKDLVERLKSFTEI